MRKSWERWEGSTHNLIKAALEWRDNHAATSAAVRLTDAVEQFRKDRPEGAEFPARRRSITEAEENATHALCSADLDELYSVLMSSKVLAGREQRAISGLFDAIWSLRKERRSGPNWRVCRFDLLTWLEGPKGERIYVNDSEARNRGLLERIAEFLTKGEF